MKLENLEKKTFGQRQSRESRMSPGTLVLPFVNDYYIRKLIQRDLYSFLMADEIKPAVSLTASAGKNIILKQCIRRRNSME